MSKSIRKSIPRFVRRYTCAFVSICYIIVATNFIALDWFAPLSKVVSNTDFPCAFHDCGCETAEQCLNNCCCESTGHITSVQRSSPEDHCAKEPVTVKVAYISAARCSGHDSGHHNVNLQKGRPHLQAQAPFVVPSPLTYRTLTGNDSPPPLVFIDSPDKIPI